MSLGQEAVFFFIVSANRFVCWFKSNIFKPTKTSAPKMPANVTLLLPKAASAFAFPGLARPGSQHRARRTDQREGLVGDHDLLDVHAGRDLDFVARGSSINCGLDGRIIGGHVNDRGPGWRTSDQAEHQAGHGNSAFDVEAGFLKSPLSFCFPRCSRARRQFGFNRRRNRRPADLTVASGCRSHSLA